MKFNKLRSKVIAWAYDKGIYAKSHPEAQAGKMLEEANELYVAVVSGEYRAIREELGDVLVTLIVQADMQNMTIEDCLECAYDKISKRKGTMKNGVFVKES